MIGLIYIIVSRYILPIYVRTVLIRLTLVRGVMVRADNTTEVGIKNR